MSEHHIRKYIHKLTTDAALAASAKAYVEKHWWNQIRTITHVVGSDEFEYSFPLGDNAGAHKGKGKGKSWFGKWKQGAPGPPPDVDEKKILITLCMFYAYVLDVFGEADLEKYNVERVKFYEAEPEPAVLMYRPAGSRYMYYPRVRHLRGLGCDVEALFPEFCWEELDITDEDVEEIRSWGPPVRDRRIGGWEKVDLTEEDVEILNDKEVKPLGGESWMADEDEDLFEDAKEQDF